MATPSLIPDWRTRSTPFDMKVPTDPNPAPGVDWEAAYAAHQHAIHEDSEDCLNADQSWGPASTDAPGGSGIRFAYGANDLDAMIVADRAIQNRAKRYNLAHWCREAGYAWYISDRVRDARAQRRVLELADFQKQTWSVDDTYDGPGYNPLTVPFMLALANKNPGQCLDETRIYEPRGIGWLQWGEAMALKVHGARDQQFARDLLDVAKIAANPLTGQIVKGPHSGINETDIFYVFHTSTWAMGALALAHRIGEPIPQWVLTYAEKLHGLPVFDYYGGATMPAFVRSEGSNLVAGTGPEQQGDPSIGWYEELCAVLFHLTGERKWLGYSCKFGVSATNIPEKMTKLSALTSLQALRQTVLLRGQLRL